MSRATQTLICGGLLSIGYILGSLSGGTPSVILAAPKSEEMPTTVRDRLRDANRQMGEVMQLLQEDKRYVPAIQGLNAFATSVGGVDAMADLESGQGVDPETFAGLYAGQAMAEVAEHLVRDPEGRLTYKNKLVRIYNPARLKQLFAARGEAGPGAAAAGAKKAAAAPKKEAADSDDNKPKSE